MENTHSSHVNNAIYDELGDRWYSARDDPVALLRAESRLRNPWLADKLSRSHGPAARVLDIGCGAGFLSNYLANAGFEVTGLDASRSSIEVASRHDVTGRAQYVLGDALLRPFADCSFDAVCAMDFLEHVEHPVRAIAEASRVLRPGGTFFFHTFNRNPLAWLVIIKGVEWFVRHTPKDLHVLRLFIKPRELAALCAQHDLWVSELHGSEPVVLSRAFWRMLLTGVVPDDFRFRFTRSTLIAYTGYALRDATPLLAASGEKQAQRDVAERGHEHVRAALAVHAPAALGRARHLVLLDDASARVVGNAAQPPDDLLHDHPLREQHRVPHHLRFPVPGRVLELGEELVRALERIGAGCVRADG